MILKTNLDCTLKYLFQYNIQNHKDQAILYSEQAGLVTDADLYSGVRPSECNTLLAQTNIAQSALGKSVVTMHVFDNLKCPVIYFLDM